MIIIGIDPGTAHTGFGIISIIQNPKSKVKIRLKCLDYGVIETTPSLSPEQRLRRIYLEVSKLLKKYNPKILAVENVYFFKNAKTITSVSEAKGVILLAAAKKKIKVQELSPPQVKMSVCGYGRAEKKQIEKRVKRILGLKEIPKPDDAADALAIAICCSKLNSRGIKVLRTK